MERFRQPASLGLRTLGLRRVGRKMSLRCYGAGLRILALNICCYLTYSHDVSNSIFTEHFDPYRTILEFLLRFYLTPPHLLKIRIPR